MKENLEKDGKPEVILYGAGMNAQEYCRYLERQGMLANVLCFAVTRATGQPATLCGKPLISIEKAVSRFPDAQIIVALQEKYHREVLETLRRMGRRATRCIGLKYMTRLLGEECMREIRAKAPNVIVERKPRDYSMLYLRLRKVPEQIFELYPMTQVPLSEGDLANLQYVMENGFARQFGSYNGKGKCPEAATQIKNSLFLAMATSEKDEQVNQPERPSYMHPVLGGAFAYREPRLKGYCYDDTGENISERNMFYSELTVTYWLWKNITATDYLGICHYRRHFCLEAELLERLEQGSVDMIVPRPRLTFPDVKSFLTSSASTLVMDDYRLMLETLLLYAPGDTVLTEKIGDGNIHFPNNMLIARTGIFSEYCQWMFPLLRAVEKTCRGRNVQCPPRYIGYLGELLTTVFIAKKCKEYHVEYVDYELLE